MPLMRPCCSCARLAQQQQRRVSTVQHFRSAQGTVKVNLQSSVVGVVSTRGDRPKQEDAYAVCSLDLPTRELRRSLSDSTNKDAVAWRAGSRPGEREPKTQQVAFLGIYDGHGGDQVSSFLRDRLHVLLESAEAGMVHDVVQKYKQVGGFFRRFKGGILQRLASGDESDVARYGFSLDQKAALAFLQADEAVLDDESIKKWVRSGFLAQLLPQGAGAPTKLSDASRAELEPSRPSRSSIPSTPRRPPSSRPPSSPSTSPTSATPAPSSAHPLTAPPTA